VALSLRSPSLGVTQHPGELELGLSSGDSFARGRPAWLRHSSGYHAVGGGSNLEIGPRQREAELAAVPDHAVHGNDTVHLFDQLLRDE
jgi:hypothetical protein